MLTEEIFESINEELGIADEVSKSACQISDFVLENVGKQAKSRVKSGIFTNTFKFKRKIFGQDINFEIKNMYFSDSKQYFAYRKSYKKNANGYFPSTNTIHIEVDYINGWHDRETLEGAIQHELEHIFQDVNAGYSRPKTRQYKLASANYAKKDSVINLISRMVYFSEESEIFAFANQAYQALMEKNSTPRENIEKTKLFFAYQTLKKGVDFLEKESENDAIDKIVAEFGITKEKLMEKCKWAIKECVKYIGRVIVKSEKDKIAIGLEEGDEYNFD